MALVVTSLNGAISLNATQVRLTAYTNPASGGIGPKALLMVDGEAMLVTDASLSPVVQVVRGYNIGPQSMTASAHNTLAPVTYGLSSDFTQAASTTGYAGASMISLSVNSTDVTFPVVDSTVYITKAGVLAITINSPRADQTNTIKLVSLTANAHLITYAVGFYGNAGTSDVATYPATAGAVLTLVARSGVWNVVATADDGVLIG